MADFEKRMVITGADVEAWRRERAAQKTREEAAALAAKVRGSHYTEWLGTIEELKKAGDLDSAEALLLECCDAAEAEAKALASPYPPPAYYSQLSHIYRRRGETDKEEAILRRYIDFCGADNAAATRTGREIISHLERIRPS